MDLELQSPKTPSSAFDSQRSGYGNLFSQRSQSATDNDDEEHDEEDVSSEDEKEQKSNSTISKLSNPKETQQVVDTYRQIMAKKESTPKRPTLTIVKAKPQQQPCCSEDHHSDESISSISQTEEQSTMELSPKPPSKKMPLPMVQVTDANTPVPEKLDLGKIDISTESIIKQFKSKHEHKTQHNTNSLHTQDARFSKMTSQNNDQCEEELTLTIAKKDFLDMQVIGQFNHSFIIARLKNDLFILDQHACDEKYNYEMLFKNTKIATQPFVVYVIFIVNMSDPNQCNYLQLKKC